MKYLLIVLVLFLNSCDKYNASLNSNDDNCFSNNERTGNYIDKVPLTATQILLSKPTYLKISTLKDYRSFKKDSIEKNSYNVKNEKEAEKKYLDYRDQYRAFDQNFEEQFNYYSKQKVGNANFALAGNRLGFWLLKSENNKNSAYFLGLSFSNYYINKIQNLPLIENNHLQFEGSLVQIIKVEGLPGSDDYSAIKDGNLFKIDLKDLMKDSDNDGYNDIFENGFGLNANNADSDDDGIDDFEDLNPLFRSETSNFTNLYQQIIDQKIDYLQESTKKLHYTFECFETDCEYFQKVDPVSRVLLIPENESKQTDYLKITDVTHQGISKMKIDKKNPNKFYMYDWTSSSINEYSVEFKQGKWIIEMISSTVV